MTTGSGAWGRLTHAAGIVLFGCAVLYCAAGRLAGEDRAAQSARVGDELRVCLERLRRPDADVYLGLAQLKKLSAEPTAKLHAYVDLLNHPHDAVKLEALGILAEATGTPKCAVFPILTFLSEPTTSPRLQAAAARALAGVGTLNAGDAGHIVPLVTKPHLSTKVKCRLIDCLGACGSEADFAAAELEKHLNNRETAMQFAAYRALAFIKGGQSDDRGRVESLRQAKSLRHAGYGFFRSLERVGAGASDWIPTLIEVAVDRGEPGYLRAACIEALGRVGAADARAVDGLLRLRADGDAFLAEQALDALNRGDFSYDAVVRAWLKRLPCLPIDTQLVCLRKLSEIRSAAVVALPSLCEILSGSDGTTDDDLIAAVLDTLRSLGKEGKPACETLGKLLPHRCKMYKDRDKTEVIRLRSYIVVTLSEIGVPSSALPVLLDTLAHAEERTEAAEIGAAVRAVGSVGSRGRPFAPYLLRVLVLRFGNEEFSLERYRPDFSRAEATTVPLETVRALGRICTNADREVLDVLEELAMQGNRDGVDSRVIREAKSAIDAIRQNTPQENKPT